MKYYLDTHDNCVLYIKEFDDGSIEYKEWNIKHQKWNIWDHEQKNVWVKHPTNFVLDDNGSPEAVDYWTEITEAEAFCIML